MRTRIVATAGCLLLLAGCATALKGSTQEVRIGVNGAAQATCRVSNGSGSWTLQAPGTVKVERDSGALSVNCEEPGFKPATRVVSSEFNGATVGNILLGGLIGVAIDAASGANYSYPETVQLTLEPACAEDDPACIATVVAAAAQQAEAERAARAAAADAADPAASVAEKQAALAPLQAEFDAWLAANKTEFMAVMTETGRDVGFVGLDYGVRRVSSVHNVRVLEKRGDTYVVELEYDTASTEAYSNNPTQGRVQLLVTLAGAQLVSVAPAA